MFVHLFCVLSSVFGQSAPASEDGLGGAQIASEQASSPLTLEQPGQSASGAVGTESQPTSGSQPASEAVGTESQPTNGLPAPPATIDLRGESIYRVPPRGGRAGEERAPAPPPVAPLVREATVDAEAGHAAENLLRQALTTPDQEKLEGTPVDLKTLLEQSLGSPRQLEAVRGYWRLSAALADYHFAVDEARTLNELPGPQDIFHQTLLHAAQTSAKAHVATARLEAVRAQHDLAEIAPPSNARHLPLPVNAPFVGAYRTYFDVLSARGAAPERLRRIDRCLPLIRTTIEVRAEVVLAADDALLATLRVHEEGRVDLRTLLDVHAALRRERRQFLAAVEEYNRQIAEYALSVSVPATTTDQLLGMLIETHRDDHSVLATKDETGANTANDASAIRRASNEVQVDEPGKVSPAAP